MALFLSTFVNKIDKKGRVSVPAPFRAALSQEPFQGFIAFRSYKYAALDCCGYARMERLSQSVDDMAMFSDEQDSLTASIFADALQLPFDGDGRVILPQSLLDYAQIEDRVAFVGRGGTFQLWRPESFETAQEEARARAKSVQATLTLRRDGVLAQGGAS
ncbi:MAG: division/cell wall cluster transcriptional repressor MraZ [Alphaproteobacteria bacterium]|nr:division/cell wall cluster transcriptional repressor MraZ [Alphaproteobacteria bacterium]